MLQHVLVVVLGVDFLSVVTDVDKDNRQETESVRKAV